MRLSGKKISQLKQKPKANYHVHRKPLLTDCYELTETLPRWRDVIRLTGGNETSQLTQNPKAHYHVHRNQAYHTIIRHMNPAHISRTSCLEDPFSYYLPSSFIVKKITVHLVVCRDMTTCSSLAVHGGRHFWGTSGCSFSETLSTTKYQETRRHTPKQNYLHNYPVGTLNITELEKLSGKKSQNTDYGPSHL
jgi:hypothetical protein